jgi:hypothetical protein
MLKQMLRAPPPTGLSLGHFWLSCGYNTSRLPALESRQPKKTTIIRYLRVIRGASDTVLKEFAIVPIWDITPGDEDSST